MLREIIYQKDFHVTRSCFLAGDIGGTNSNFGVFEVQGTKLILLLSLHAHSQTITNCSHLVGEVLRWCKEKYGITIRKGCIGAAGIVSKNRSYVKPTNLTFDIDAPAIMAQTDLESLVLINDFEAVGMGIDYIDPQSIITINAGNPEIRGQKGCIGAGTGMGKAGLLWNNDIKRYVPLASEGGHGDCASQTNLESQLFTFIQSMQKNGSYPVSWEDVLSGHGIALIYQFLGTQKKYLSTPVSQEIAASGFKPDFISRYAREDQRCQDTFDVYTVFYARCAKNFALDALALNGMYIAGGIAAKNVELFKNPLFMQEFTRCGKHQDVLTDIPVYVIADYNVSLYGAAAFFQYGESYV